MLRSDRADDPSYNGSYTLAVDINDNNRNLAYNPDTHVLGEDGKLYEKKIVAATGIAVGVNRTYRSAEHVALEDKLVAAIHKASTDGVIDPDEIRDRIRAVSNG